MEESEGRKEGCEGGEGSEGRGNGKEEREKRRNSRVVMNRQNIQPTYNWSLRKIKPN